MFNTLLDQQEENLDFGRFRIVEDDEPDETIQEETFQFDRFWFFHPKKYIRELENKITELMRSGNANYVHDARMVMRDHLKVWDMVGMERSEKDYYKHMAEIYEEENKRLLHEAIHNSTTVEETGQFGSAGISKINKSKITYYLSEYGLDIDEIAALLELKPSSIKVYLNDAKKNIVWLNGEEQVWSNKYTT